MGGVGLRESCPRLRVNESRRASFATTLSGSLVTPRPRPLNAPGTPAVGASRRRRLGPGSLSIPCGMSRGTRSARPGEPKFQSVKRLASLPGRCSRMPHPKTCRWGGDGCYAPAGYGRFGDFCKPHAERLAGVDLSARPTRPAATTETAETRPTAAPDALGRLPLPVRAAALGRYVQSADHPVTRAEAVKALGLASAHGSLPRIVQAARQAGYVAPGGRGYRPGAVTAPEPEQ